LRSKVFCEREREREREREGVRREGTYASLEISIMSNRYV